MPQQIRTAADQANLTANQAQSNQQLMAWLQSLTTSNTPNTGASGRGAVLNQPQGSTTNTPNTGIVQQPQQQSPVSPQQLMASILPDLSQNQVNPVTGWTDKHADIMQSLIDKAMKTQAQQSLDQHGVDASQNAVDVHRATSTTAQESNNSSGQESFPQQSAPQQTATSNNNYSNVLDPLLQAAKSGNTTPPAQQISTPASPSNVQRGNFEQDSPKNIFEKIFGMPQAYQDSQGVTHYKPGGFLQAGRNQDYLDQAKSMQELSGTKPVQPEQSIAYGLESAKQAANNVPMNQSQRAEYNLQVQNQALSVAKDQVDQFNSQSTPVISSLQKLDQLLPLGQSAINGDRVAQGSLLAGAKELYGTAGNILGQSAVGKLATLIGGKFSTDQMKSLVQNMQQVRQAMIKKLAATERSSASRIGNLKIGDKSLYASDLLSHPYSSETSPLVNSFKSMDEANKSSSNLKDGALVTIGGKQYKWSAQ